LCIGSAAAVALALLPSSSSPDRLVLVEEGIGDRLVTANAMGTGSKGCRTCTATMAVEWPVVDSEFRDAAAAEALPLPPVEPRLPVAAQPPLNAAAVATTWRPLPLPWTLMWPSTALRLLNPLPQTWQANFRARPPADEALRWSLIVPSDSDEGVGDAGRGAPAPTRPAATMSSSRRMRPPCCGWTSSSSSRRDD
jgi:hypothetical protein